MQEGYLFVCLFIATDIEIIQLNAAIIHLTSFQMELYVVTILQLECNFL